MKKVLFLGVLLLSVSSQAVTRAQFFGSQMMINISSVMYDGTNDGSPQALFNLMDRPEQDSVVGRGKVLEAPQKVLNFICAHRGENNYQCSIYIHRSAFSAIAPKKASFVAEGEFAASLFSQFHSENGRVSYHNEDGTFAVEGTEQKVVIVYSEGGV